MFWKKGLFLVKVKEQICFSTRAGKKTVRSFFARVKEGPSTRATFKSSGPSFVPHTNVTHTHCESDLFLNLSFDCPSYYSSRFSFVLFFIYIVYFHFVLHGIMWAHVSSRSECTPHVHTWLAMLPIYNLSLWPATTSDFRYSDFEKYFNFQ